MKGLPNLLLGGFGDLLLKSRVIYMKIGTRFEVNGKKYNTRDVSLQVYYYLKDRGTTWEKSMPSIPDMSRSLLKLHPDLDAPSHSERVYGFGTKLIIAQGKIRRKKKPV